MNKKIDATNVTFRVGPLVNLASVLRTLGFDADPIFRQHGFEPEEFQDPDHRASYIRASRVLQSCVDVSGCEQLGLLLGQKAQPSHLGLAGFLARSAPKVEDALRALVHNLDLHDEAASISLETDAEFTTLSLQIILPGVSAREQICDLSATMMYKIMKMLCGEAWTASAVKLVRREPEDRGPYRRYFRTSLFFNSTECAITFNNSYLDQKPPSSDKLLFRYLEQEAAQLHDLQHHELMEELPAALRRGLQTNKFAAHQIADMFGILERTLHRRLRDSGTNFRRELDSARKSVSENLLESTSLPVYDIANVLGYADSSGFIRAFQRWTGTSPAFWRKQYAHQSHNDA